MGSGQSSTEVGGFRIFKVNPGSPAFEAGLEVFFDFIVDIGGTKMDSDQNSFFKKIQQAENTRTKLVVYNIRTHSSRDAYVLPRRWGGAGLLGAVVRYDTLENADNQGIRVLDVFPQSPAKQAGLIPYKDYLLGTTEVMFRDMDELVEIVNLSLGKKMQIYVYNSDTESIREAALVPDNSWGGDGSIGADIRTGLLHRIPAPRRPFNFVQAQQAAHALQPALYPEPAPAAPAVAPAAVASQAAAPMAVPPAMAAPAPGAAEQPAAAPMAVPGTAPAAPAAAPQPAAAPTAVPPTVAEPESAPGMAAPQEVAVPPPMAPPTAAPASAMPAATMPAAAMPAADVPAQAPYVPAGHVPPVAPAAAPWEAAAASSAAAVGAQPQWASQGLAASPGEAAVVSGASSVLAGLSGAALESPERPPANPAADPSTPATAAPPKVPPPTPITEAVQGEIVYAMSPSVVHIPPHMQTGPGVAFGETEPGAIFESPPPAPGVIYETQAQQVASGLL
mmetsp:Transcript_47924/g.138675  ORF Transcript_47924/g.138675 Transcript_47924/m.138675 type:complete len:505 (-) Transcript_47924:103-1617(-)